jgi:hypothetical protein
VKKFFKEYFLYIISGILLTAGIFYSVITETLIPLFNQGKTEEFIYNLIGIPVILTGTGLFVYGGIIFVIDTFKLFGQEKMITNIENIRNKNADKYIKSESRKENFKMLLSAWKRGGKFLGIGGLLIFAGGILINLKEII